ncbi:hypothetical protein DFH09DRAFT_625791 [Mycena vulgaris]|nr:hypothetical protein DFH09DRAFT_625791 [Mycena vulgaris]
MAVESQAPSGLDADPTAYLALPRFNCALDFDFQIPGAASSTATVTYALTYAPADATWPVLVFFNGLGGHRFIAAMIEGIARAHRVQILTLDKPGGGSSASAVPIPLALRTRWMHAALLAVLSHTHTRRFAALSHSNGLFYALYTLLHLPPTLTATSWTLTGPFVPPSISSSAALRLAAALPASLPNALGSLLQIVPPFARAASWSGGFLSASAGLLSGAGTGAGVDDDEAREARKPAHERGYMHRHVGSACRAEIMRRGMAESRVAMGQEALLCLHGGDTVVPRAGEGDSEDSVWGLGASTFDAAVLQNAFARLAELHPDDALRMRVVYGKADGMVPPKGRAWLRGVLEERGLLRAGDEGDREAWKEVEGAGHDEVLFLDEVVGGILGRVEREEGAPVVEEQ